LAEAETSAADIQFFLGINGNRVIGEFENDRNAGGNSENNPVTGNFHNMAIDAVSGITSRPR